MTGQVTFALGLVLVSGLLYNGAMAGISCYNATATSMTSASVSDDPSSKDIGGNLVSDCDYCTITKSVTLSPMTYVAVVWKCEKYTPGTVECSTTTTISSNSKSQQFVCQCCGDKCNQNYICGSNCTLPVY